MSVSRQIVIPISKAKLLRAAAEKPYRSLSFDYECKYSSLDLRKHPELYKVGRGEQGVLLVEPYKSEILPHWRFKDIEAARKSSKKILALFRGYLKLHDFVGMDIARKFLQMGFTRSRRYANFKGGRKYDAAGGLRERGNESVKAAAAQIFYEAWKKADSYASYQAAKSLHKKQFG